MTQQQGPVLIVRITESDPFRHGRIKIPVEHDLDQLDWTPAVVIYQPADASTPYKTDALVMQYENEHIILRPRHKRQQKRQFQDIFGKDPPPRTFPLVEIDRIHNFIEFADGKTLLQRIVDRILADFGEQGRAKIHQLMQSNNEKYVDGITGELMTDPVYIPDIQGVKDYVFDRKNKDKWFREMVGESQQLKRILQRAPLHIHKPTHDRIANALVKIEKQLQQTSKPAQQRRMT